MTPITATDPRTKSPDLTAANLAALRALFPELITEGKDGVAVNLDVLKQLLGDQTVTDAEEKYGLNWHGKRKARQLALTPSTGTLRPCRADSVDWDTTQNLMIEGDNLEVLKLLQKSYAGKVKLIYIDPPYNTGNDFIYDDDYSMSREEYKESSGEVDEEGNAMFDQEKWKQNSSTTGRFHSEWLSMIYPRLKLSRNLLTEDGVVFISIDDNEVQNTRKLCDEIFGESNFIGIFVVNSTPNARDYGHIGKMHEYVIFYAKNLEFTKTEMLPEEDKKFTHRDDIGEFNIHPLYNSNVAFHAGNRKNLYYPFYVNPNQKIQDTDFLKIHLHKFMGAIEVYPPLSQKDSVQFVWRWGKPKSEENLNTEIVGYRTGAGDYRIVQKMRHSSKLIRSLLTDTSFSTRRGTAEVEGLMKAKIFSFPKPLELLSNLAKVALSTGDTCLDLFSGSATTAHAVMQLNAEDGGKRRHIMVQLPEPCDEKSEAFKAGYGTIAEIGKERIRRAGRKILSEWQAKQAKEKPAQGDLLLAENSKLITQNSGTTVPDTGFRVLKIDSSNMTDVYYQPDELTQDTLSLQVDNLKPDRNPEDLLFQVLLDWGVDLALPITEEKILKRRVFFVAENALAACFDNGLDEAFVKELAKRQPLRAVFRDSGYANDAVKINFEQIFKALSPHTEIKTL